MEVCPYPGTNSIWKSSVDTGEQCSYEFTVSGFGTAVQLLTHAADSNTTVAASMLKYHKKLERSIFLTIDSEAKVLYTGIAIYNMDLYIGETT